MASFDSLRREGSSAADSAWKRLVRWLRRRGLPVVYPLTDEPWGVRRFFLRDPGGTVVNVLAHHPGPA